MNKATHTQKIWCKIIEIFTTHSAALTTDLSKLICTCTPTVACASSSPACCCFALESRKDALGKWWGSGSQRLNQIAGWHVRVAGWGSYPSPDRSIQLSYLQLLEWRKIYAAY